MSGLKTGNFKDLTINSNLLIGNTIEFGINTDVTIKRDNNNNLIFNDSTFQNKTILEMINTVNDNVMHYDTINKKITIGSDSNIQFDISGTGKNIDAIGTVIKLYFKNSQIIQELIPSRGFQSSVDYVLTIGLGDEKIIDSAFFPKEILLSFIFVIPPIISPLRLDNLPLLLRLIIILSI